MRILAIDTSCDETSVAIVENDWVIANKISSQIEIHKKWGGVVPNIAKIAHQENINFVIQEALDAAKITLNDIDIFAATKGPGLAIALEVGLKKAIELSKQYEKPFIPVNHMEGHIYSCLAKNSKGNPRNEITLPAVALLISGGHTEIVLMKDHGQYELLGETLDDAVGEAFDKVAKMLNLGYPGGPIIEKIALNADENRFKLPIPMKHSKDANFSYSGLKTAVLNAISKYKIANPEEWSSKDISDFAASFQKTAVDSLILKLNFALNNLPNHTKVKDLLIAGGVSANLYLRKRFRKEFGPNYNLYFPTSKKLYGDNAAMIGVAAYYSALYGRFEENLESIDREPNWRLDEV